MSNVIGFLEKMGQDAALRHAGNNEIELALASAQIDPALRTAILGNDRAQLEALLGARTNVYCLIAPGKQDDEEEEEPSKEDEISASHTAGRRMASSS